MRHNTIVSPLPIQGHVSIATHVIGTPADAWQSHWSGSNTIVKIGWRIVRDLIARGVTGSGEGSAPSYIAIGESATAVQTSDIALGSELIRELFTKRLLTEYGVVFQYLLQATQLNGETLQEAGLFDAATLGNMMARAVYTAINKTSSIEVLYTWVIEIGTA